MPITIQELLASDTVSQAADKINFNFDQLLLNGGGPAGPQGIQGPIGPMGIRGLRGSRWFVDVSNDDPGANPNTVDTWPVELEDLDLYLQKNGQVWQYDEASDTWIDTGINLKGPQGDPGITYGFSYVGGFSNNGIGGTGDENVAFPGVMPNGAGAQDSNRGVSAVMIGAVASTVEPPLGLSFENFQISDAMARQLDSSKVSLLVHQLNSSSKAIKLMGGDDTDKYEQDNFNNLSSISVGTDDRVIIEIPKEPTEPTTPDDLIGFELLTNYKGQKFESGKSIDFYSGYDNVIRLNSELSDINFNINTSNSSNPAKFAVNITDSNSGDDAVFEIGGRVVPSATIVRYTRTGKMLLETSISSIYSPEIEMYSNENQFIKLNNTTNSIISSSRLIRLDDVPFVNGSGIEINNVDSNPVTSSIRLKGNLTYTTGESYLSPFITAHKSININKNPLTQTQSAIYIRDTNLSEIGEGDIGSLSLITYRGDALPDTAIEHTKIYTSAVETKSTENSTADYVGFIIENESTDLEYNQIGFKLTGVDRESDRSDILRFHANEHTTAVYNRMQYVSRELEVSLLSGNINAGGEYEIPKEYMDSSYLDIHFSYFDVSEKNNLNPFTTSNGQHLKLKLPDGKYSGQRLNLHVVVSPYIAQGSMFPGSFRSWPGSNGGSFSIIADTWLRDPNDINTQEQENTPIIDEVLIPELLAGNYSVPTSTLQSMEIYVELLWVNKTYEAGIEVNLGAFRNTKHKFTRGWVATNGSKGIPDTGGEEPLLTPYSAPWMSLES